MKEIGGFFQLEQYNSSMLHENAIALNTGRNCLAYLLHARNIKKILVPKFLCDSIDCVCAKENVEVEHYSVGSDFYPCDIELKDNEWLYFVNYYGQFSNREIENIVHKYNRVIVDNVQAYFQPRILGVDTIYTCRKYFGVPDGAFLYTDVKSDLHLEQDKSYERMIHVLGRYEGSATTFYSKYVENEALLSSLPVMRMSGLTENLLRTIDYELIKNKRNQNYCILDELLGAQNKLNLVIPDGAFMYPFYTPFGDCIRKKLQGKSIFIPTLWPDVFNLCTEDEIEYDMAKNILPIPIDQRYSEDDMKYLAEEILKCID